MLNSCIFLEEEMGKLKKFIAFTAFLAALIGIGMVAVQGQGTLKIQDFDLNFLSRDKRIQIDKLRDLVKGEVTHEYMLGDAFLLKWLLDQDLDVKQAAEQIKQNLKWRAEQNIDSILDENWADVKSILPYSVNTTDKFGRPLYYVDLAEWDVAKLVSEQQSGKDRLERFFYMLGEENAQRVRDLQAEGKNVTQSVLIVNVDNFSLEKHGCIQCLLTCRKATHTLALNFPLLNERRLFVNVPYVFEVVFAYLPEKLKRYMNMFGRDKSVWEKTMLQTIDRDQLPSGLFEQQRSIAPSYKSILLLSSSGLN